MTQTDQAQRGHHHHGPHHGHHHHGTIDNIRVALILNFAFSVIEFIGGLWTGSVAVLTDAVHDLGDTIALALAYLLERLASKQSTEQFSYGFRRMSLLSALITSSFLVTGSILILIEAVPRLWNPVQPQVQGMLLLALLGISVNGYAAWRVQKGRSLNERAVSWHLMEDVFGWVAVLIGTIVMMLVHAPIIDPLLSIGFTGFILYRVFQTMMATMKLFLQGAPADVNVQVLRQDIESIDDVLGIHDVHVWSLDGERHVMTAHVVVREDMPIKRSEEIKVRIRELVSAHGKIHVTIEMEALGEVGCPVVHCVPNPRTLG